MCAPSPKKLAQSGIKDPGPCGGVRPVAGRSGLAGLHSRPDRRQACCDRAPVRNWRTRCGRQKLKRHPEPPAASAKVELFIQLGNNGMPESYSWAIRNEATGAVTQARHPDGGCPLQPLPARSAARQLQPPLLTTRNGAGRDRLRNPGSRRPIGRGALAGDLPDITLVNRGPYLAGHNAPPPPPPLIDLTINREGLNVGGADFQLTLYKAKPNGDPDGAAVTWSYVSGAAGRKANALALPPEPGEFIVTLERGDGKHRRFDADRKPGGSRGSACRALGRGARGPNRVRELWRPRDPTILSKSSKMAWMSAGQPRWEALPKATRSSLRMRREPTTSSMKWATHAWRRRGAPLP